MDPTAQTTPLFGVPTQISSPQPNTPIALSLPSVSLPPATYKEQDGKHTGVAGVARDILGTLGDFLLTRLHMPAMYGPSQERRKLSVAQQNIDSDPIGAIQQVSSLNPVFGAKLRDQYIDNQRLAASNASTTEARTARLAQAQEAQNQRTRGYAASMLGSMATWDDKKRQQFYPQMREQVLNAGRKQGLDLSGELPENYDSTALDAFMDGAVPVGTQRAQRLTRERIDNQDEQAGARVAVTARGQDLSHQDRQSGQAVTARGQDIRASTAAASRSAASDRLDRRLAAKPAPVAKPKPTGEMITYLRQHPEKRDSFDGKFGVGMAKRVLGN